MGAIRRHAQFVRTQRNLLAVVGDLAGPWQTFGRSRRSRAPLAQSVERFHGKEKVDSSILSGGSTDPSTFGLDRTLGLVMLGDVAQLVRALDS